MTQLDAAYFDQWYTDIVASAERDRIVQRVLGLPPGAESTGLLRWDAVAEVAATLDLAPGEVLLDLACGRGGYGLEIARRCDVRVIGVDFSAVAIEYARRSAERLSMGDRAEFRVGDMAATGLPDTSVDAVVCIDSIQFARPLSAALAECHRVLGPGGRLTIVGWEVVDRQDERLPPTLRGVDLATQLPQAGFADVEVARRPQWDQMERDFNLQVVGIEGGDDPALRSLRDEAERVLALSGALRRILATARRPR